ncbi:hypothetical protein BASA81_005511 [Batrachochytrium salamandrivorans]|nr:hypothetical protein BASA81_005511 [Batrachochytrium salamandrivorans]
MDKLMRHLTSEVAPASSSAVPLSDSTGRLRLRREMASAQRVRVLNEFGYELKDQEPIFALKEYLDTCENDEEEEDDLKVWLPSPVLHTSTMTALELGRVNLARACRVAVKLGLAGDSLDDCASLYVPGAGILLKPLGIRFGEVTAQNLALVAMRDLPKLHLDLYKATPSQQQQQRCVFSIRNAECELVAIHRDGLLPLCQDALRVYGLVQRVEEETLELRASRPTHRNVTCWLVKMHGLLCSHSSVELALSHLLWTTRACQFQVRAMQAVGGDLARLDIPQVEEILRRRADLVARHSNEAAAQHVFTL